MVNYIKTTNGYFYKICKNGKKRISEDEYNKQRKIKKMTGGVKLETITIDERRSRNEVMENVFLTGDILANGKTSTISKINKKFMDLLTHVKTNYFKPNNNIIGKQRRIESNLNIDITYVGEIRYIGSRHSGIVGMSNIWVQKNYISNKVRYIVQIEKLNPQDIDKDNFGIHVDTALKNLCNGDNYELVIKALSRIGVQLDGSRELIKLIDEISNTNQYLDTLREEKSNLYLNKLRKMIMINHIDWTFTNPKV